MNKSFKEILLTTQIEVIGLAQIRNAIHTVLKSCTDFIDEYDVNFHIEKHLYTHYLIDTDYFLQFTTAQELDDYIQKPHKWVREINLSILYDRVIDLAEGKFADKYYSIYRTFEKMIDNEIDYSQAIEFIDENLLDELIELIDDYKDEAQYLKNIGYK